MHDATVAEISGTWTCTEGTQVALHRDGRAVFRKLDGADFDFDDGWRLSGTGTWRLTDTRPRLSFFYGDPDAGNEYTLSHIRA
ncbi:hypothetical protein AB0E77_11360 [Streptomyces sp. NPDC032940]|uniref:hypothetical protein n=1 Tax=Streptomyces sp. NPDC032940 TaxID=3155366 RepID=UPI0033E13AC2